MTEYPQKDAHVIHWVCRGCGAPCWTENEYWASCDVCGAKQRFKEPPAGWSE